MYSAKVFDVHLFETLEAL